MIRIPKVFHRIWLGERSIPETFEGYWRGWQEHHPDWTMKTWDSTNVSLDAIVNRREFAAEKTYAGKADVLRLELLKKFGGIYIDTDFECYRNIEDQIDEKFAFAGSEMLGIISTSLLGAVPNHPFFNRVVAELPVGYPRSDDASMNTGPNWISSLAKNSDLWKLVDLLPTRLFYPYLFKTPCPENHVELFKSQGVYAAHHWAASWKKPEGYVK